MRATQLSDEIWNGLSDLVKRSAPSREVYFAKVVRVDEAKRLIYTDQHGPLGIPMLTPEFEADYYDTQAQTVDDSSVISGIVGAAADNTVATAASGAIAWQKVGNAMVATGAAIARSKLDFGSGLVNADIASAAAIARSKLDFGSGLVNADVATAAAIAYAKLVLTGAVVNADISASAAIAISKLASYPSDARKALYGDGSWNTMPKWTRSTLAGGPPASPQTGDIWVATDVESSSHISWMFCYESGDTYPWKFVGGPAWKQYINTTIQNTSDNTWQTVANTPSYTIPRTGQYNYEFGGVFSGNNAQIQYIGIGVGGSIYNPYVFCQNGETEGANVYSVMAGSVTDRAVSARSAGDVINYYMYASAHTNTSITYPWISVTPIAIA